MFPDGGAAEGGFAAATPPITITATAVQDIAQRTKLMTNPPISKRLCSDTALSKSLSTLLSGDKGSMSCVVAHHIVNIPLVDPVRINCPDQWRERIAHAYKESELNSQDGGELRGVEDQSWRSFGLGCELIEGRAARVNVGRFAARYFYARKPLSDLTVSVRGQSPEMSELKRLVQDCSLC